MKSEHIIDALRDHYARQRNGIVPRFAFVDEVRISTGFRTAARHQEEQFDADGKLLTKLEPNRVWDPYAPRRGYYGRGGAWTTDGTFRTVPRFRDADQVPNREDARIDAWALDCWKCQKAKAYYMAYAFEVKVSRSDFLNELKDPWKRVPALELSNYMYFAVPKGLVKKGEIPDECGLLEVNATGHVRTAKTAPYRDRPPLPEAFMASALRTATKRYVDLADRMTLEVSA